MAETFNKKERNKKKAQKRKEKQLKKEARGEAKSSGNLDDMMAYVDENGIIRDTPPDSSKKKEVKASSIVLGVPKREKEGFVLLEDLGKLAITMLTISPNVNILGSVVLPITQPYLGRG